MESEEAADQALFEAMADDAKKTEDESMSALDDIAAELGELMGDANIGGTENDLIGEGEEN